MKKFSIIDPLYMSFYSRDLYRDVAANWSTGLCFLYLLSLLALCCVPETIRYSGDISYFIETESPKFIAQMPDIRISKGEASIREPQPYFIRDKDSGKQQMIIDTTGSITSLDNSNAFALLTKNRLVIRIPEQKEQVLDLKELGDITVTKAVMKEVAELSGSWFAVLFYPFLVFFEFIFRSAQALIIALFGTILTRSLGANLGYKGLARISLIAITPLIIFNTLLIYFRISLPLSIVADILLITAYQIFAIRSNAQQAGIQ
jgi:hypothetical protein